MLPRQFLSILKEQLKWGCGIQMKPHSISRDAQILISLDVNWIERAQVLHAIYFEQVSSHGTTKKQACVALSTVEAEYIAIGTCCDQISWLKQQLSDYGLKVTKVPLFCDNNSVINLTKNLVHHSRTKHIEIRHHFIKEQVGNGVYEIKFTESEKQLVDLFTKPFAKDRFNYIRIELGILDISNIA